MTSSLPGKPITWIPRGVCDALDGTMAFAGAMADLQNLIPDPTTRGVWQPRPAAMLRTDVAVHIPGVTFVSAILNLGTRIYGMVGPINGKDQPFCYDVLTQQYLPITAPKAHPADPTYPPIKPITFPFSPQPAGNWSPPTMTLVGSQIIVAHPGFVGASTGFFGVINISNNFNPTWTSQNTSPVQLVHPPTWVANFNGRCYYFVNPPGQQPAAYLSDSLNPTVITNANQIITFGDNLPLTCAAGLALNNQLGGIIQSLIVFKGVTNIYQITGDYAFGNIAVNSLNVATGTFAPNTVVSSEKGLLFMAPDGIRLIDFQANVSDPIGNSGQGVTVPFINAQVPSRSCAAFNTGIYRVQVLNVNTQQEWWYDFVRNLWSGPHTTGLSLITRYQNTFICTLQGAPAKLWQSDPVQNNGSTYVENGVQLLWVYQPVFLPDPDDLCSYCCVEATLSAQLPAPIIIASDKPFVLGSSKLGGPDKLGITSHGNIGPASVTFVDQDLSIIDTVTIMGHGTGTLWNQFNWNQALWNGPVNNLFPHRLDWHVPVVFRRGTIVVQGTSLPQTRLGQLRMRLQELGYLQPYIIGAA